MHLYHSSNLNLSRKHNINNTLDWKSVCFFCLPFLLCQDFIPERDNKQFSELYCDGYSLLQLATVQPWNTPWSIHSQLFTASYRFLCVLATWDSYPSCVALSRMAGKFLLAVKIQVRGDFTVEALLAILGTNGLCFIYSSCNYCKIIVMLFIKALYKSHHTSNHSLVYLFVSCPTLEVL